MSNQDPRHTPSPSSSSHPTSKLPRFLQKQSNRDRPPKSITDPNGSPSTSSLASGSSASTSPELIPASKSRQTSKFLGIKAKDRDREEKARKSADTPPPDNATTPNNGVPFGDMDEPPVIVEPVMIPRPRTRSERPVNSAPETHHHIPLYSSSSSTSRIGDFPTRLSGWFSHTFNTSSSDLTLLPTLLQQTSPKGKGPSALLTAAKHGKGHLDKAMRYLLDSDATPDKCSDPIWLLGVQHPGYEPPSSLLDVVSSPMGGHSSASPPSLRSSTSSASSNNHSYATNELSQSTNSMKPGTYNPAANWPPVFYMDFTSRIWLTYRSQFPMPIRDNRLGDLCGDNWEMVANSPITVKSRPWNWGGEKTWTSDTGWGCMLRTGQSLLANALIHMHLGRDWRRPPYALMTADYATYVQILTWFLDTPAPEAPFSVHRMALAGKELGTDVGQWFGPSVAAGAIRTLVQSFEECGLAVSTATDSTLYQSQVYAASRGEHTRRLPHPRRRHAETTWGDRPVLLLLGIRLGIEGVNPIYYDTIKMLYTFPQSVGIAGGRPSSSYYFVGSQADNLFYLDPHNTRPAIPLRPPPPHPPHDQRETTPDSDRDRQRAQRAPSPNTQNQHGPTSPASVRTASSNFSYHAPVSPSPLQKQVSSDSADSESNSNYYGHSRSPQQHSHGRRDKDSQTHHGRWRSASASASQPSSPRMSSSEMDHRELGVGYGLGISGVNSDRNTTGSASGLDPLQQHYCTAYNAADLKTFHCERVRKMPMSGLDPSMLIGFLCRDEADWWDFRRRVGELPKTIFSVQDEPPTWPSDSDDNMGLESISEPDDMDMDLSDEEEGVRVEVEGEDDEDDEVDLDEDEGVEEVFFDTRSGSASTSSASAASNRDDSQDDLDDQRRRRSRSEEIDTEEDPVDPVTPGPNSKFAIVNPPSRKGKAAPSRLGLEDEERNEFPPEPEDDLRFDEGDIEDDWVDPSLPTPTAAGIPRPTHAQPPPIPVKDKTYTSSSTSKVPRMSKTKSSSSSTSKTSKSKKDKGKKQKPVPVPSVRIPPPQEHYPFPVAPADEPSSAVSSVILERTRSTSGSEKQLLQHHQEQVQGKRMHTARARDGGRTQSGGVKGIFKDD